MTPAEHRAGIARLARSTGLAPELLRRVGVDPRTTPELASEQVRATLGSEIWAEVLAAASPLAGSAVALRALAGREAYVPTGPGPRRRRRRRGAKAAPPPVERSKAAAYAHRSTASLERLAAAERALFGGAS